MANDERMQLCYEKAKEYLLEMLPVEFHKDEIKKYFNIEKVKFTFTLSYRG